MDLNEVAVFVEVVQTGSFTKAARKLGMPISTVSHRVSSLEQRLGLTLIQRTTRKLHITSLGQAYFQRCVEGLKSIEAAEEEITASQQEPRGVLKITAPVELGSSVLPDLIAKFARQYPHISVEVILTDRRVDLLAEGVDLAIRAGELKDSTLIAKKLGTVYFALFASPRYLTGKQLNHPRDLLQQECLRFTPLGRDQWKLTNGQSSSAISVSSRLLINDLNMIKILAADAQGIALLPAFYCHQELQSGQLVRVLPGWRTELTPVHFVYPGQKFVTPKLEAFIALATDAIRKSLVSQD